MQVAKCTFTKSDRVKVTPWKFVFSAKRELMRGKTSPLFEIALVLVRFDHVASVIINADHGIV
jgi:hypothetical protein